jgi:hypothetical protein
VPCEVVQYFVRFVFHRKEPRNNFEELLPLCCVVTESLCGLRPKMTWKLASSADIKMESVWSRYLLETHTHTQQSTVHTAICFTGTRKAT